MTDKLTQSNNININKNHIVDIKTVQSSAIKILIEALKEWLAQMIVEKQLQDKKSRFWRRVRDSNLNYGFESSLVLLLYTFSKHAE